MVRHHGIACALHNFPRSTKHSSFAHCSGRICSAAWFWRDDRTRLWPRLRSKNKLRLVSESYEHKKLKNGNCHEPDLPMTQETSDTKFAHTVVQCLTAI